MRFYATIHDLGWLLEFYILTSGDSVHSCRLYSAAPLGDHVSVLICLIVCVWIDWLEFYIRQHLRSYQSRY